MKYIYSIIAVLLLAGQAWGADQNIYVDSDAAAGGDGTIGTPFDALSDLNWTTIAGYVAGGDTVYVNLARGSVFRETLTIGASGASGRPITIQAYGTGDKPVIKGSDDIGTWTAYESGAGFTWQATVTDDPNSFFVDGVRRFEGSGTDTLNDHEWFFDSGTLYYRDDSGDPDGLGLLIEAPIRANCILCNNYSFITFASVRLTHDRTAAYSEANTVDSVTFTGCEFVDTQIGINTRGTKMLIDRSLFDGCRAEAFYATGNNNTTGVIQYSAFKRCFSRGIRFSQGTTLSVDNCVLTGIAGVPIHVYAGTVTVRNCLLGGYGIGSSSSTYAIVVTAGTCNVSYSLVLGRDRTNWHSGATLGDGIVYDARHRLTDGGKVGVYSVVIDDINESYRSIYVANVGDVFRESSVPAIPTKTAGVTGAIYNSATMSAQQWTDAAAVVAGGDELAVHGRHSPVWDIVLSFKIQYTGAGSACAMTISGKTLSTTCTDAPGDNLSLDLTAAANDTMTELRTVVAATGVYAITSANTTLNSVPSTVLADVTGVDIKTAATDVNMDPTRYWDEEIEGCAGDIETNVADYVVRSAIYPGGNNTAAMRTYLAGKGYVGARLASNTGSEATENFALYGVAGRGIPSNYGMVCRLSLNGALTDTSGLSNTFTASGTAVYYTAGNPAQWAGYCRDAVGYNALNLTAGDYYIYRADDADWGYSWGDWCLGVYVRPTALTGTHTLYYHGTDASNYMRLYLDANGAAKFEIVSAGSAVVSLATANSTFAINTAYSITVRQTAGKIQLLHGTGLWANTVGDEETTSVAPADYTGAIQWFAGYNWGTTTADNYYVGYADEPFVSMRTTSQTVNALDSAASMGAALTYMCHLEIPYDVFKLVADTIADYDSGTVYVATFGDAMELVRGTANANVSTDGLYARWTQADAWDFQLSSAASTLVDAGADLSLATDYYGNKVPSGDAPDIGVNEFGDNTLKAHHGMMAM